MAWWQNPVEEPDAHDFGFMDLVNNETTADPTITAGLVLLVLAACAVVGGFATRNRWLPRAAGAAIVGTTGLFVARTYELVEDLGGDASDMVQDVLGAGVFAALAGGLIITFSK
jgi:hypothetical protein